MDIAAVHAPLEVLAASAELRALVDSVDGYAIFLLDPEGTVVTWNRGAGRLAGYEAGEIVGQSFNRFYPDADRTAGLPERLLGEAARDGRVEHEGWRVRKDGTRFWADAVTSAVRGKGGELIGFVEVTRDLTDRRNAEQRLRANEERLRLMIESVKDYAIFMLDADGRVATWNEGARRTKGYTADEIIGKHISTFYTREEAEKGRPQRLLHIAATEGRVEDEGWRVRKDGTRFWADVVISRIVDPSGRLIGYTKVTRDLTARREAEEALRQSEERIRLMIESVNDYAIFMLDPDGRVASWNPGAERLKGYTAQEIVGRHFSVFYPPEDAAAGRPERELEIAAATGRYEEESIRVRKDGTRFWANVVLSAMRTRGGRLLGFTKVTRDMTDRRRAAEELTQRARQQSAVAQLGMFALQTTELAGLLERAVHTAREILGYDEVEIVGSTDESSVAVPIHAADRTLAPYGFLCVRGRSTIAPADVSFLQALANVVSTAIARTQMEEQLRAAERKAHEERSRTEQAQEALRERDEFISVAAHELRTPLTALQLKLQGVERALRGTDRKEILRVEAAVRQTERMARLIDRLLDVSRIAQGRLEMAREEMDLAALVRQVAEDFREPAAQARAPLQLELPESARGTWDRLRIEQVLVNVLSNAVKYGAGKPIRIRLGGDGERVRLEVTDQGIGISAEDLGRIFGRFERAASIRHYGGMGLGLYITRHIVEGHGGTVSVSSKVGEGSTFVVELPRSGGVAETGSTRSQARA